MKKIFDTMENNEAKDICAKCGGQCCKRMACQLLPEDIFGDEEPTLEKFIAFMKDSHYAVDWWEGDVRGEEYFEKHPDEIELYVTYYVRPAHKGVNRKFDPSWGGTCVFLAPNGCSLPFERRPYGGKVLVANEDFRCHNAGGVIKEDMVAAWLPYQEWFDHID